jgi:hypothetical protein
MSKQLVVFLVFAIFSVSAKSQSFMGSYGGTFSIFQGKETETNSYKAMIFQTYGTFFARYNLSEGENSSLSLGIPLSAGIGLVNNDDGAGFSVDVPLMGDYNFGCDAIPESEKGLGGFFGAGFGYTYTSVSSSYGSVNLSSYGPMIHAGVRLIVSQKFSQSMTFGLYYKLGIERLKYRTMGFNFLVDL